MDKGLGFSNEDEHVGNKHMKKMLNITPPQENANQNHNEIPPHTFRVVCHKSKTEQKIRDGYNGEKFDPHSLLVGM